jgi:hypothetical protein
VLFRSPPDTDTPSVRTVPLLPQAASRVDGRDEKRRHSVWRCPRPSDRGYILVMARGAARERTPTDVATQARRAVNGHYCTAHGGAARFAARVRARPAARGLLSLAASARARRGARGRRELE